MKEPCKSFVIVQDEINQTFEGTGSHHLYNISRDLGLPFLVTGWETQAESNESEVMARLHGEKMSLSWKRKIEENEQDDLPGWMVTIHMKHWLKVKKTLNDCSLHAHIV